MRTTPPRLALLVTAAALLAAPALAQPGGVQDSGGGSIGLNIQGQRDSQRKAVNPPAFDAKTQEGATWPMLATLVIMGASLLAAIIPSKRGHQD